MAVKQSSSSRSKVQKTTSMQAAINIMRKDEKYRRLRTTFSTHENFRLPLESLMDELKLSHQERSVRRLNPTDPQFVDKLIEANLRDQAVRSRTTEILIRCVRAHTLLSNALESLRYHLLIKYDKELRGFRTVAERSQVVSMALKNFESFLTDVSVLKQSAELVVADVDKAAWSLKNVVSALSLHTARESRL